MGKGVKHMSEEKQQTQQMPSVLYMEFTDAAIREVLRKTLPPEMQSVYYVEDVSHGKNWIVKLVRP